MLDNIIIICDNIIALKMQEGEKYRIMSVPTWKRNESKVEYIDTARELVIHTIKGVRKFPKSATFIISSDIMKSANDIFRYVIICQNCFPKSKEDIDFRRNYLLQALGELDNLDCKISIAIDAYSRKTEQDTECDIKMSDYSWAYWGELIYKERNLIKKVLESDSKRSL